MGRDPSKQNMSLYYHYHQERGQTTEDCRTLRDHLGQLVKARKLKQFLHQPGGQVGRPEDAYQRDRVPRPALGTINVFATPRGNASSCLGVMSVASNSKLGDLSQMSKRAKVMAVPTLGFLEEDKGGTFQLHDDALVVTIQITGYNVRESLWTKEVGLRSCTRICIRG